LNSTPFRASLAGQENVRLVEPDKKEAMKSRAELLAEIEEKRLENKELDGLSIVDSNIVPGGSKGYDPYDHPGRRRQIHDIEDVVARRRRAARGGRRP
jgi:hypothetical protein